MFALILIVILAVLFGLFSVQNEESVSLVFANYTLSDIPVFVAIGFSILLGLLISWLIHIATGVSHALTLRKKDSTIQETKDENRELVKQNHKLEVENAKLKTELGKKLPDEDSL